MKILIVEDDARMLELMVHALQEQKMTVDTAMDGQVAYEKARARAYDLIVLDIKLPGKNGFDVIAQLRMMEVATPILVVSSCGEIDERVKGLNLGADDYLVKHFAPQEFVARCKALLRRKSETRRNILKCRDIMINLDDMSVYRTGKRIVLSKKELGILVELLKNKDKIVGRTQIIQAVWGERDIPVTSNTIDVHIRTLRSKIDRPFKGKRELVETVRGFGYTIKSK